MSTIYEIHRMTRENLAGKTTTGVLPKFNYTDTVVIEEGPAIVTSVDVSSGLTLNHPILGRIGKNFLGSGNPPTWKFGSIGAILGVTTVFWADGPSNNETNYVVPNSRGEFIERFRDEWFKPPSLPNGVEWDITEHKLKWGNGVGDDDGGNGGQHIVGL